MKKTYLILFTLFISSCSNVKFMNLGSNTNDINFFSKSNYSIVDKKDYSDHFQNYANFYLNSEKTQKINLSKNSQEYLVSTAKEILNKNELFFKNKDNLEFYIINNSSPFHFSFPGKKIFFSTGLIQKYIKSEKLLYCLLAYELIRSEKKIYHKTLIIPTGTIDSNRILSIMKLTTPEKVDIHKWAFYILKRVGIDTDNYLSWIQIQNRNSIDFSRQLGDVNSISREESLFKAFLIQNTKESDNLNKYSGSSREFYNFVKSLKS